MDTKGFTDTRYLMTARELRERAGEVTLLDLRPAEDYAVGHIAGARPLDLYGISLSDSAEAPLASAVPATHYQAAEHPESSQPDAVEAPGAALEAAGAKHRLVVHGPASVVYALTGREHELAFTFGRPAGGIGGAVALRAEIHIAGRPSRLVLESDLAATAAPGAETRAEAWVLLTDLRAGDRLLLRVEPMDETVGPVYLSGLKLK